MSFILLLCLRLVAASLSSDLVLINNTIWPALLGSSFFNAPNVSQCDPTAIPRLGCGEFGVLSFWLFPNAQLTLLGTIPSEFIQLTLLSDLRIMSYNASLTGTIPPIQSTITYLDLSNNSLSGASPSLQVNGSLDFLFLGGNQLSTLSPLPHSIQFVYIEQNKMEGTLPSFNELSTLQRFVAYSNRFSGALPLAYPNSLTIFKVYGNRLSGPVSFNLSSIAQCKIVDWDVPQERSCFECPAPAAFPSQCIQKNVTDPCSVAYYQAQLCDPYTVPPSLAPTISPSFSPTTSPTSPTASPTPLPSSSPTWTPTTAPTTSSLSPTSSPTMIPSTMNDSNITNTTSISTATSMIEMTTKIATNREEESTPNNSQMNLLLLLAIVAVVLMIILVVCLYSLVYYVKTKRRRQLQSPTLPPSSPSSLASSLSASRNVAGDGVGRSARASARSSRRQSRRIRHSIYQPAPLAPVGQEEVGASFYSPIALAKRNYDQMTSLSMLSTASYASDPYANATNIGIGDGNYEHPTSPTPDYSSLELRKE